MDTSPKPAAPPPSQHAVVHLQLAARGHAFLLDVKRSEHVLLFAITNPENVMILTPMIGVTPERLMALMKSAQAQRLQGEAVLDWFSRVELPWHELTQEQAAHADILMEAARRWFQPAIVTGNLAGFVKAAQPRKLVYGGMVILSARGSDGKLLS